MSTPAFEIVKVTTSDRIAEITLSRPKALNAINRQFLRELEATLVELAKEPSLACVIITGQGEKAFVAGADIAEMKGMTAVEAQEFSRAGHRILHALETFPVPVIAAVNGFALGGGCELALSCDIIYAAENAKFGQPEVKLGLIPGFGGCVRLPRKVGMGAAAEWIFTGEIFNAQTAKEIGLVREVMPPADLLPKTREIAKKIAGRAPLAVRAAKRALVEGLANSPAGAAVIEQLSFAGLFGSNDAREGMTAFVEKRDAKFSGE